MNERGLYFGRGRNGLVFIEPVLVLELIALKRASTWSELKANAPRLYREALHLSEDGVSGFPTDDAEFSLTQIPAFHDGGFPDFPERLMLRLIPAAVQERFGKRIETALNGSMLVPRADDETEIVSALGAAGFKCVKRQDLIDQI